MDRACTSCSLTSRAQVATLQQITNNRRGEVRGQDCALLSACAKGWCSTNDHNTSRPWLSQHPHAIQRSVRSANSMTCMGHTCTRTYTHRCWLASCRALACSRCSLNWRW